ncbi:helix-turn-helix transcriptional regulator [Pseudomonas huaxiensis]|uniref:helix-turn-helix transcriptional regulator n=1 Tax=Pseudomonas huaxiensis TaxID=2213017 RepID=UPI000DA6B47F|nr:LuxR C-terminal-related transcriptional regulator [Pseudomonas huaxiensis]
MNAARELGDYCLHAFSQQVPASLAAFYRVDEQLQACDFQLLGMQAPMHHHYLEHYRHLDPLNPDNCQAIGLPVVSLRQGLAHHDAARGREYLGFLRQHRVVDVVEIVACVDERPVAGLSLLREGALGPFEPSELERLLPLHGLMQMAARQLPKATPDRLAGLTPREREIALLLQNGACNKTLARQLELGLPTVKTHLINLFRKVGVKNRTELIGALFL